MPYWDCCFPFCVTRNYLIFREHPNTTSHNSVWCLKDNVWKSWNGKKMSETSFSRWLEARLRADSTRMITIFKIEKYGRDNDLIREELSLFLETRETTEPYISKYTNEFEKLPIIGTSIWYSALEWVIEDIQFDGNTFNVITKRIQSDGSVLRKSVPSYKVRTTLLGYQVVSESLTKNFSDWFELFYGPEIVSVGIVTPILWTVDPTQIPDTVLKGLVAAGAATLATETGSLVWNSVRAEQSLPVELVTLEGPPGLREYETINAITGRPGFSDVLNAVGTFAEKGEELITKSATTTGNLITKTLETAVLIGVLGVLYRVFTITE